jgi:hypothetical protein
MVKAESPARNVRGEAIVVHFVATIVAVPGRLYAIGAVDLVSQMIRRLNKVV